MNASGVPDALGVIGHPQLGHVADGARVCPGNALEVQESVIPLVDPAVDAPVKDVCGGKNHGP